MHMKASRLSLIIILILLFLTTCGKSGIKGRYWYFVDNIIAEGDEPIEIRLWLALPVEHRGQGVKIGTIFPEPVEIIQDSLNGNEIVFWQIQQPKEGQQLYFYYDFEVFPEEVNTNVDPMKIAPYETESAQYLRYTISEPWIEITPEIVETAAEIVGAETNPYFQARKIFHWVVDNMRYEYPDTSQRGVAKSFPKRKGDCGEYAWAFCALCRSVGIPARSITCIWMHIEGGHAWAEFLLPPFG